MRPRNTTVLTACQILAKKYSVMVKVPLTMRQGFGFIVLFAILGMVMGGLLATGNDRREFIAGIIFGGILGLGLALIWKDLRTAEGVIKYELTSGQKMLLVGRVRYFFEELGYHETGASLPTLLENSDASVAILQGLICFFQEEMKYPIYTCGV